MGMQTDPSASKIKWTLDSTQISENKLNDDDDDDNVAVGNCVGVQRGGLEAESVKCRQHYNIATQLWTC